MAALACLALWNCALPAWAAGLASILACGHAWRIVSVLGRSAAMEVRLDGRGKAELNFAAGVQSLTGVVLAFRGPLASLAGTDASGRTRRLLWWPDTLPSTARRQLRLVSGHAPSGASATLPPGY